MRKKRHTGEGRQVPFGQHKKKIQEELEQQQNRNRNSEEGLQGDEEENRGSGVGSRSSLLSHPYVVQDRVATGSVHLFCAQEAPRLVPEVRQRPRPEELLRPASDP